MFPHVSTPKAELRTNYSGSRFGSIMFNPSIRRMKTTTTILIIILNNGNNFQYSLPRSVPYRLSMFIVGLQQKPINSFCLVSRPIVEEAGGPSRAQFLDVDVELGTY